MRLPGAAKRAARELELPARLEGDGLDPANHGDGRKARTLAELRVAVASEGLEHGPDPRRPFVGDREHGALGEQELLVLQPDQQRPGPTLGLTQRRDQLFDSSQHLACGLVGIERHGMEDAL